MVIFAWRAWTTSSPVLSTCLLKSLTKCWWVQQKPKPTWLVSVLQAEKPDKNLLKEHKRDSGLSEAQEKGVAFWERGQQRTTKPGPCPFLEMKFYQNAALVAHSDAAVSHPQRCGSVRVTETSWPRNTRTRRRGRKGKFVRVTTHLPPCVTPRG